MVQHPFSLVTVRPNSPNPNLQCAAQIMPVPHWRTRAPLEIPQPWIWQRERGQEHVGVGMCRQEHVYARASVPISAGTGPRLSLYQPLLCSGLTGICLK